MSSLARKTRAITATLDSRVERASGARVEVLGRHCCVQYYARVRGVWTYLVAMMERDNFNTELFIDEIEKRVALWDLESTEYSNRTTKRRNWEEIVEIFCEAGDSEEKKKALGK